MACFFTYGKGNVSHVQGVDQAEARGNLSPHARQLCRISIFAVGQRAYGWARLAVSFHNSGRQQAVRSALLSFGYESTPNLAIAAGSWFWIRGKPTVARPADRPAALLGRRISWRAGPWAAQDSRNQNLEVFFLIGSGGQPNARWSPHELDPAGETKVTFPVDYLFLVSTGLW